MTDEGDGVRSGTVEPGGWRRTLTTPRFGLAPRAWQVLVAIVFVSLLARLVALGARPAHYDEGRVAYWTLRYAETGHFEYRFIIHGPFVQHVNSVLFPLLGANDFVMRLPVALIGGLFPLSAVLFRDYLREEEIVALALFLGLNPLLLYYSRFFRSDVPVAAFMFVAFGLLVRLAATRRLRYLHAGTVFVALGFASKENAVVYLACWIGASVLVADTALFRPRNHDSGLARLAAARDRLFGADRSAGARRPAARLGGHVLLTVALFAVLTLVMYAPRAGDVGGVGLWAAVGDPSQFPAVVDATLADLERGFDYWFGRSSDPGCFEETVIAGYICYLGRFLATLGKYAAPLSLLAVGGFLLERYARAESRPLVMFASYWGFASVLGYPLGTDIWGAWVVTHAVVPLAIPAAVGLGSIVGPGTTALSTTESGEPDGRPAASGRPDAAVVGLVVLLVVAGMVVPGVGTAFVDTTTRSSTSDVVQFAQPAAELRPALEAMEEAIDDGDRVVFYGEWYYLADESVVEQPPAADRDNGTGGWFHRLPLPWYTEAFGAEVASAKNRSELEALLADEPPVVVVQAGLEPAVRQELDGDYRTYETDLRAHLDGPSPRTSVVIFVEAEGPDERRAPGERTGAGVN